jgi:hypothetical protein
MPAVAALHAGDPRKELLKKVGDISDLQLFHNSILVAVYIRPKEMQLKGGHTLIMPDKVQDEDRYQGKIGLVIAKGPIAFVDDERTSFHGQDVEIGDWVAFRASDGWQITLVRGHGATSTDNAVLCRVLVEADIRARVPAPDYLW